MRAFIILSIAVLATFTAASPVLRRSSTPDVFKLLPGPDAPAEISDLGYLQWDGDVGGDLGWFPTNENATEITAFIQDNTKNGIAFYSRNTALEIYLRPTHGTPMYFVKLGNPNLDDVPALILSDNFTLDCNSTGEFFGYNNADEEWIACGSGGSYSLYFGPNGGSGCLPGFSLVAEHVPFGP